MLLVRVCRVSLWDLWESRRDSRGGLLTLDECFTFSLKFFREEKSRLLRLTISPAPVYVLLGISCILCEREFARANIMSLSSNADSCLISTTICLKKGMCHYMPLSQPRYTMHLLQQVSECKPSTALLTWKLWANYASSLSLVLIA